MAKWKCIVATLAANLNSLMKGATQSSAKLTQAETQHGSVMMTTSNLTDHPIGAVFPWTEEGKDEVMLEVVPNVTCQHCYFRRKPCAANFCVPPYRDDERIVAFHIHNPKDTE